MRGLIGLYYPICSCSEFVSAQKFANNLSTSLAQVARKTFANLTLLSLVKLFLVDGRCLCQPDHSLIHLKSNATSMDSADFTHLY